MHEVEQNHHDSEAHVSVVNEEPSEPAAINEPSAEESADIMDQVFSALPQITTSGVIAEPPEPEVLEKVYELPQEDLAGRKESSANSTQSSHESAIDVAAAAPHVCDSWFFLMFGDGKVLCLFLFFKAFELSFSTCTFYGVAMLFTAL